MISFWLILSGHFDVFHITMGFLSIAIVLLFNRGISSYDFLPLTENKPVKFRIYRLVVFVPFFLWDIAISTFRVAYLIIHPKLPIQTVLIKFKSNLPDITAKVLLGNCITLTPGTLTLQIKGNEFLIHSLTKNTDEVQIDRALASEIGKLYGLNVEQVVYDEEIISSEDKIK